MFFRRSQPQTPTFSDRVQKLREAGFEIEPGPEGKTLARRDGCGALLSDAGDGTVTLEYAGILLGREVARLVDVGFQKLYETPTGKRTPARAEHLKAVHAFTEDLREAVGLTSLYNQGLGTTNDLHRYDRVRDRDHGVPPRPWEAQRGGA